MGCVGWEFSLTPLLWPSPLYCTFWSETAKKTILRGGGLDWDLPSWGRDRDRGRGHLVVSEALDGGYNGQVLGPPLWARRGLINGKEKKNGHAPWDPGAANGLRRHKRENQIGGDLTWREVW